MLLGRSSRAITCRTSTAHERKTAKKCEICFFYRFFFSLECSSLVVARNLFFARFFFSTSLSWDSFTLSAYMNEYGANCFGGASHATIRFLFFSLFSSRSPGLLLLLFIIIVIVINFRCGLCCCSTSIWTVPLMQCI